jgi:C4-dicarboxylate-specific signal transduction histidine kinase
VELRVADNGPGFGDLQLEDLPLTTSKHQGMGLGLFVVQTTITNHGGTMALGRSALGGAEVLLRLPLLKL